IVLSKSKDSKISIRDLEERLGSRAEELRIAREKSTKLIQAKPEQLYFQGELDGKFQFICSEPLPPLNRNGTCKFKITFYLWGGPSDPITATIRHILTAGKSAKQFASISEFLILLYKRFLRANQLLPEGRKFTNELQDRMHEMEVWQPYDWRSFPDLRVLD